MSYSSQKVTIAFDAHLKEVETERAIKFSLPCECRQCDRPIGIKYHDDRIVWLPKSQIEVTELREGEKIARYNIEMPEWLVTENELEDFVI